MGDRDEGLTAWIRAATADGRLKSADPLFASMQLQGLVKGSRSGRRSRWASRR